MAKFVLAAGFAAGVLASPIENTSPFDKRTFGFSCQAVNAIVNVMRAQDVATPFCSSVLSIEPTTKTLTCTSTPPATTITTTVGSTDIVTTVSTSTVYGTTTVYPVVAVSVTSTCALGATAIPDTPKAKRGWTFGGGPPPPPVVNPPKGYSPVPIGTPTCLKGFVGPSLTSACSCLNIPTPTSVTITTTTLAQQTITKVIAGTVKSTVTSVTTSTSFTSTYSATQYYTSTFTILPSPTSVSTYPDGSSFGNYPGLDFPGLDITNFFCYAGGPDPPSPYPACTSYADCVAECVYYNDNNLGNGKKCGTVTYNAPKDGSSGSCYLKTGQVGCGSENPNTNSSVILPLIPNDLQ